MTAKEIRELRASLQENRETFGKRLGVTAKTIERWELMRGSVKGPAAILLRQIAQDLTRRPPNVKSPP